MTYIGDVPAVQPTPRSVYAARANLTKSTQALEKSLKELFHDLGLAKPAISLRIYTTEHGIVLECFPTDEDTAYFYKKLYTLLCVDEIGNCV